MGVLIIAAVIGLLPAFIAQSKGRSFGLWWLYGAAIFIIATPHALLLKPDHKGLDQAKIESGLKKCPQCAEFVKEEARICRFCQHTFDAPAPINLGGAMIEGKTDIYAMIAATVNGDRWLCADACAMFLGMIAAKGSPNRRGFLERVACRRDFPKPNPITRSWKKSEVGEWAMNQKRQRRAITGNIDEPLPVLRRARRGDSHPPEAQTGRVLGAEWNPTLRRCPWLACSHSRSYRYRFRS
nr:zinc ribbon domain-containing protein [Dyella nitratireducens]